MRATEYLIGILVGLLVTVTILWSPGCVEPAPRQYRSHLNPARITVYYENIDYQGHLFILTSTSDARGSATLIHHPGCRCHSQKSPVPLETP